MSKQWLFRVLMILLVSSLGFAEARAQADGYVGSALANVVAVTNYDCLVETETMYTPVDNADAGYSETKYERLIFDPDSKTSLYFEQSRSTANDPSRPPSFKVSLPFEKRRVNVYLRNQFGTSRHGKISSFDAFVGKFPRMDFACFNGHPFRSEKTKELMVESNLAAAKLGTVHPQPNGDVLCVFDKEENEFRDEFTFEPMGRYVKRMRRIQKRDGLCKAGDVYQDRRYKYEEFDLGHRLIQMDFDEAASKVSKYARVGSTHIKWLKMNFDELSLPLEPELMLQPGLGEKKEWSSLFEHSNDESAN